MAATSNKVAIAQKASSLRVTKVTASFVVSVPLDVLSLELLAILVGAFVLSVPVRVPLRMATPMLHNAGRSGSPQLA
eukprot:CAMPEP_0170409788 /NCGR_PEP_ID=MMETSP0117_2-20130122/29532_1 /TAXON_ID=400756 /ORGANISM="Durinskia baltica, Strain CSIRO CS-38" /LENGTH=76 /DNA_ID=CAMNT_0010667255 /DNA_START=481 /DNA_END=707 /DNA_ORIENTATION=+